jgi:hypothetical protein
METGVVQRGTEGVIKTADSEIRTFMVAKAPLYDPEGKYIGTVGNSVDITD